MWEKFLSTLHLSHAPMESAEQSRVCNPDVVKKYVETFQLLQQHSCVTAEYKNHTRHSACCVTSLHQLLSPGRFYTPDVVT